MFFYRFTLHLLRTSRKTILRSNELASMFSSIRNGRQRHSRNASEYSTTAGNWGVEMLRSLLGRLGPDTTAPVDWDEAVRDSWAEPLDEKYVSSLLSNYDLEHMRFRLK